MQNLDPKNRESFDRLQELIDRIKPAWTGGNIIDIVPALKTRKGVVEPDRLVLGFRVLDKQPRELLEDRGYREIPQEIEGVRTDVILVKQRPHDGHVDEKATRSAMFDTVVGGCAVGNKEMGYYGTFAMPLLASDGHLVGVTNEHVLIFDGEGHTGDDVWQPRFHLNAEVSLDSADCCPNGQLHYRGVDNPIVDASMAVFTAAIVAAALSDVLDPHRRGQVATVPDPDERTLRETLAVDLQYPELPLPGRPYKLDVKWKYERHTDRRVQDHSVAETQMNEHVLDSHLLVTDHPQYPPGAAVRFTALLSAPSSKRGCSGYFVTAAALSPSHNKAYKIILQPAEQSGSQSVQGKPQRRCFHFPREFAGKPLHSPTFLDGLLCDGQGRTMEVVPISGGAFGLRFPDAGVIVTLPTPAEDIWLTIRLNAGATVKVVSFAGTTPVANQSGPSGAFHLTGHGQTSVKISGGRNEAIIEELCIGFGQRDACVYQGSLELSHDEEIGHWTTYLFGQTRNDVPLNTEPTIAAQTIGGLPVTANFVDAGETDSFIYGHRCNVSLQPDGGFDVIAPNGGEIG